MQIVLSQCTLLGNVFSPLPLRKSKRTHQTLAPNTGGKRTVTVGSPCESSLEDRFSNKVEGYTLGNRAGTREIA